MLQQEIVQLLRSYVDGLEERSIPNHLRSRHRPQGEQEPATPKEAGGANSLTARLKRNRRAIVPWLDRTLKLDGATVLEIGCGQGASTISLAEQGARVTAVDVDAAQLERCRERVKSCGLNAEFVLGNGADVDKLFSNQSFDLIVFWACLEHMTIAERLSSLAAAWRLARAGALIATVETPNRLWYFDSHTSELPFFDWLPEELAFHYSRFSKRTWNDFSKKYRSITAASMLDFARRGRGVSFHEFEVAIGPVDELDIVTCMQTERRARFPPRAFAWRASRAGRYEAMLSAAEPRVPSAFHQPFLYLAIRRT